MPTVHVDITDFRKTGFLALIFLSLFEFVFTSEFIQMNCIALWLKRGSARCLKIFFVFFFLFWLGTKNVCCFFKIEAFWAGKMAWWWRRLPCKPDDLSSIPGTQLKAKGESKPHKVILWSFYLCFYTLYMLYMYYTHYTYYIHLLYMCACTNIRNMHAIIIKFY